MVYAQQKFIWNEEGKQRVYARNYFNTKDVIYQVYKHEPILKNECFLPYILQSYANVKQQSTTTHNNIPNLKCKPREKYEMSKYVSSFTS